MKEFEIAPGRMIGGNHPCFFIAEIGQNHQGDINIAKKMIKIAKECGADCAKFQKCVLSQKYNRAALRRPYTSKNSWGPTYGEHKAFIEFSNAEFIELKNYAESIGIIFATSCGDKESFDFADNIGVPFYKIASADSESYDLIRHAASKDKPLIISTGMRNMDEVKYIYDLMKPMNPRFTILQCTSTYPLPLDEVNLNVIPMYRQAFPDIPIGYSGHESGTAISLASIALGAKVIERHFTLDKTWKGSDHAGSLEPDEMAQLIKEIREVEQALGNPIKKMMPSEEPFYKKLGKTIVTTRNLKRGDIIQESDLDVKVAEPKGIMARDILNLVGLKVNRDIVADESIMPMDVQPGMTGKGSTAVHPKARQTIKGY